MARFENNDSFLTDKEIHDMSSEANGGYFPSELTPFYQPGSLSSSLTESVTVPRARVLPHPKKGRRKLKYPEDEVLRHFMLTRNHSKPAKKEYIRCHLIRGHKKCIRQSRGNGPKTVPPRKRDCWEDFCRVSQATMLHVLAQTSNGPQKSYNNAFCKSYFEAEFVGLSYFRYTEYLFAHEDPSKLCQEFHILCCDGNHDRSCTELWEQFKKYVQVDILSELNIVPFNEMN